MTAWECLFWHSSPPAERRARFKSTKIRMATVAWTKTQPFVWSDNRFAVGGFGKRRWNHNRGSRYGRERASARVELGLWDVVGIASDHIGCCPLTIWLVVANSYGRRRQRLSQTASDTSGG